MANIDATPDANVGQTGVKCFTWTITENDTPVAITGLADYPDKTIQVSGTFGGTSIDIQGACRVTSPAYISLTDPQGNALNAITTARIEAIEENVDAIKPVRTGGASTSVVITLLCNKAGRR